MTSHLNCRRKKLDGSKTTMIVHVPVDRENASLQEGHCRQRLQCPIKCPHVGPKFHEDADVGAKVGLQKRHHQEKGVMVDVIGSLHVKINEDVALLKVSH